MNIECDNSSSTSSRRKRQRSFSFDTERSPSSSNSSCQCDNVLKFNNRERYSGYSNSYTIDEFNMKKPRYGNYSSSRNFRKANELKFREKKSSHLYEYDKYGHQNYFDNRKPLRAEDELKKVERYIRKGNLPLNFQRNPKFSDLPLEWWDRDEDCKDAKSLHMDRVDDVCYSREDLVLLTTLWDNDIILEPNMFPCKNFCLVSSLINQCFADMTPKGVEHYTLWSVYELKHEEVIQLFFCHPFLIFHSLDSSICGCMVGGAHASCSSVAVRRQLRRAFH